MTGPALAVLVFDGWCGFCTRSVDVIRRLDRHGRLEVLAHQRHGVYQRTGLTRAECEAAAWVVHRDGTRTSGARAVADALAVATGRRWPVRSFAVPGVAALADRAYAWVAANRRRLPGAEPWCQAHPGSCEAGVASCAAPAGRPGSGGTTRG